MLSILRQTQNLSSMYLPVIRRIDASWFICNFFVCIFHVVLISIRIWWRGDRPRNVVQKSFCFSNVEITLKYTICQAVPNTPFLYFSRAVTGQIKLVYRSPISTLYRKPYFRTQFPVLRKVKILVWFWNISHQNLSCCLKFLRTILERSKESRTGIFEKERKQLKLSN